MHDNLVCW